MSGAAPLFGTHQASALTPHINYTDVALTQSELTANWSPDRTTPSGGYNSTTFASQTAAELRVDNTHANTSSTFYQSEGIQRAIPGSDAIKANLYVDGSWTGKSVRAGLWGVAHNAANDVSAYPIVEYTTAGEGNFTGWRAWDGVNGGWTNLPSATATPNAWNTIEIVHNNGSTKFNIYINGALVSTNTGGDSTSLNAVILNSYNFATGVAADNYAAHWSNLGYGNVTGASVSACATTSSVFTTDLSTWNRSETRSAGHNEIVPAGLHIYTDDASSNAKVAGYYTTNFPLSGLGDKTIAQSLDYQATTGINPGLQLVTDFDNNGTADGILVGESIYGNNWWLSNSAQQFVKDNAPQTGGGNGSNWFGTPNQWLSSFPDAKVLSIGYSLGSGVHGDGIIKKISLGCTDYTFGLAPPVAPTGLAFTNPAVACDGYTDHATTTTVWNPVANATSYNYRSWTTAAGSAYNSEATAYVVNGINGTSLNGTFNQGEGKYFFEVQAVNAGGATSPWSTSCGITYDTTIPVAPTNLGWKTSTNVVVPNNGTTNVADGTASWTASTSSDIDHYIYKYWNDIPGNQYKVGSEYTTTTTATSLAGVFNQGEGTHHFCVVSVDHAGHESACSATFTITYDHTGPVVTDNFTVNMGTGDKVTLAPTVTGDSNVTYLWSVSDSKLLTNPNESLTGATLQIGSAPKGTYTVTVKVTDQFGNATTKTYNVTITPGNSNSAAAATGQAGQTSNQPQTLGATTGGTQQTTTTTTTGSSNSSTAGNSGKVKGESTTKPTTVNFANAKASENTSKNSLLSWWWLPVIVAVVGLFWFFFGRRSHNDQA